MPQRFKVIVIRNGSPEAVVFENAWPILRETGALQVDREHPTCPHALETVAIFAHGHWTELHHMPTQRHGEGEEP